MPGSGHCSNVSRFYVKRRVVSTHPAAVAGLAPAVSTGAPRTAARARAAAIAITPVDDNTLCADGRVSGISWAV